MIYILKNTENINEDIINNLLSKLPDGRRKKALSYRLFSGKKNCVLSYFLFLYGYQKESSNTDIPEFAIAKNGKPFLLEYPDIQFNISHCDTLIACGISNEPIGIDVQNEHKITEALIKKVCTKDEVLSINAASNPLNEFCKIWSIKESILKLTGEGIARDLKSIEYSSYYFSTIPVTDDTHLSYACTKKTDFEIIEVSLNDLII